MRVGRAAVAGLLAVLLAAPVSRAADSTPPDIAVSVRGAPGQDGWFVGPVVVNWTVGDPESAIGFIVEEGCQPASTISSDTPGVTRTCRARSEGGTASKSTTIRLDATPPTVTSAGTSRPPDAGGWFNHPVAVTWSGTDATSGIASCTTQTYAGPDTAEAVLRGTCADRAGNTSASSAFALVYDATPPSVTGAAPTRPPSPSGWYTAPLELLWAGADATSGVAACTSLHYDGATEPPRGTCTDHAGNVGSPVPAAVRYDATPPQLTRVRAAVRGRRARITWRTDASQVQVSRRPGRRGRATSVVYRGDGRGFTDTRIRRGRRYAYTVLAVDQAGNGARGTASIGPRRTAWLSTPPDGALVTAPPVLRWRAVREARFYNVQLFRGRRKILTRWPTRARLSLRSRWRHDGRTYRLAPGTYRWYVWAGYGRRSAPRYGRLLGRRSFTVG